jgi:hypothetical protein
MQYHRQVTSISWQLEFPTRTGLYYCRKGGHLWIVNVEAQDGSAIPIVSVIAKNDGLHRTSENYSLDLYDLSAGWAGPFPLQLMENPVIGRGEAGLRWDINPISEGLYFYKCRKEGIHLVSLFAGGCHAIVLASLKKDGDRILLDQEMSLLNDGPTANLDGCWAGPLPQPPSISRDHRGSIGLKA